MLALGNPYSRAAIIGEVLIDEGGDAAFRIKVGERLSRVVNALEEGDLSALRDDFTEWGYAIATDLVKRVPMANGRSTHRTRLLTLPKGGFEVRDIRVSVQMGETANHPDPAGANPYKHLVFRLTPEGLIEDVRFGVEATHYRNILEEGRRLNDTSRRQKIVETVEYFRTAYYRKDLTYLQQVFSDDALIIVGRRLEPRRDLTDLSRWSGLQQDKIEFIRLSKEEYLSRLGQVFQRNAFINVVFDSLEVLRHESEPNLYGVTVKQHWFSSTYSDTGWVFLLWDFEDEEHPTIYVRSWQPEPFPDGSVLNLYDFHIIRGR